MTTAEVANRLVALCKEFKNFEAMETLYEPDIVSVEPFPGPDGSFETNGKAAVIQKSANWAQAHEIHAASVEGPYVGVDKFSVIFNFEITHKASGNRKHVREVGIYTMDGGLITREEFHVAHF
ncbi:MAG: nuclear transport factor 2 family protein [Bryobacterales bacterium]|nr:nuclear transport factor 2 family protein [Bryobacterales bacterium]